MKALVFGSYANFFGIDNTVQEGELKYKKAFFTKNSYEGRCRMFLPSQFKIIPPELENESVETIKFYLAL